MTPYADMTPDQRLQAVQRLAEFCDLPFVADSEHGLSVLRGEDVVPWNPFLDANALEEVEAAIRGYHWVGRYALDWSQDEGYRLVVGTAKGTMIDKTGNCNTKADALAQVVAVLVERKG